MKILVTGLSGSGKTTIMKSANLKNIYFADDFVKQVLYSKTGPVLEFIKNKYPESINKGKVDTFVLGPILFNDKNKLEEINILIAPFIRKWIDNLPKGSLIEMAAYLNNQNKYKNLFDKIILIKKDVPNISEKFKYTNKKIQPIINKEIKTDFIIENNETIDSAVIKLKEYLKSR